MGGIGKLPVKAVESGGTVVEPLGNGIWAAASGLENKQKETIITGENKSWRM